MYMRGFSFGASRGEAVHRVVVTAEIVLVAEGGEEAGGAVDAAVAVLDAQDAGEDRGAGHAGDDLGLVAFDVEDHQVDLGDPLLGDELAEGDGVDRGVPLALEAHGVLPEL